MEYLNSLILQLFDAHAPIKTFRRNKNYKYSPWITDNIKLLQKLRNKALQKFKVTKNPNHYAYYKQLRNYTTFAIRSEKKAYLRNKFNNSTVKENWAELKKLNFTRNNKVLNIPNHLSNVDDINKFFIKAAANVDPPKIDLLHFYKNNLKNYFYTKFCLKEVDQNEIFRIISTIKTNACGSDKINITLIQLCCPHIIPFLTHVINECIKQSYFPQAWKHAFVRPLPKLSQPKEFKDLRSISILPTFSKILEKIVDMQARAFLNMYNILPAKQSGFRKHYSCATAMANVSDDILTAWDEGKLSVLILLDYTKAFDLLNHEILLSILHFVGFSDETVKFFKSFLENRGQQVVLGTSTSNIESVKTGVPQGSILGPLLFTIYTCQFNQCLQFCQYHLYADDTQLYCSFPLSDLNNVNNHINTDLKNLINLSTDHHLKINPMKSSITVFGNELQRAEACRTLAVEVDNIPIKIYNTSKSLGIIIDSDLRFRDHVTSKLRKAYGALKLIYNQRHFLTQDIKKLLCDSLVLSVFNHGDCVYGPCLDQNETRRIQKVQNSCLRLIFGIRRRNRISHKMKHVGWLNMYNRRSLHFACFCYKIIKFKTPTYLFDKIKFRTDIHNVNLRNRGSLTVPRHRKELFKRSFSYNVASCLNALKVTSFSRSCNMFRKYVKETFFAKQ